MNAYGIVLGIFYNLLWRPFVSKKYPLMKCKRLFKYYYFDNEKGTLIQVFEQVNGRRVPSILLGGNDIWKYYDHGTTPGLQSQRFIDSIKKFVDSIPKFSAQVTLFDVDYTTGSYRQKKTQKERIAAYPCHNIIALGKAIEAMVVESFMNREEPGYVRFDKRIWLLSDEELIDIADSISLLVELRRLHGNSKESMIAVYDLLKLGRKER